MPNSLSSAREAYEQAVTESLGLGHAIAFSYARSAFGAILSAAGLAPGDAVMLPALTCKVVPLALLALKLKPIYVDISPDTLNLDASALQAALDSSVRAIMFQHTFGSAAGIASIAEIARKHELLLVEDCAQCLPFTDSTQHPGQWGHAAIFSNNLRKPLPAGSGGIAVTNDSNLAQNLVCARDAMPMRSSISRLRLRTEIFLHRRVMRPALYWPLLGLARRFGSVYRQLPIEQEIVSEITAAAVQPSVYQLKKGLEWFARLEELAAQRSLCCREFREALPARGKLSLPMRERREPLYFFPVRTPEKDRLLDAARARHLELVAWPDRTPIYPVESESALPRYGYMPGSCPRAEDVARSLVGLPTDFGAQERERKALIELLKVHDAQCR